MTQLVERVRKIILEPKEAWQQIKSEETTTSEIVRDYLLYLAAVPPLSYFIGQVLLSHPRLGLFSGMITAIVLYILIFVALTVAATVINAIAAEFEAVGNEAKAFKLVAYSCTAPLLSAVFFIIPELSALALLGFYGIYILYLGIPEMTDCPQEKALSYTVASVITISLLAAIAFGLARIFTCR
ncbi:YIP1 family protein [candidate division KSB1 bacterium]|nr:YIP1 family protein [candidate division KSB1 bacterium]